MNKIKIVSGRKFKKEYITTESGKLEKVYFSEDAPDMGSVLGDAKYFSVTWQSSEHYQSDEYFDGIGYFQLNDDSKILLFPNAMEYSGYKLKNVATHYGADGLYDPLEGSNGIPHLGLAIYNNKVIYEIQEI